MNTDKIYAEAIANEYAPKKASKVVALKKASKVVALKKLDQKAKLPAEIFGYSFGIISALIFGVGMCFGMQVIGPATTPFFILGIVIGIIGMAGMAINYPLYQRLLKRGKEKYAFEIIELAKEISEEK